MSIRNLVLILMFGGLIFGAYYCYRSHTNQPLQADLITIDTNRISRLRIHPKEGSDEVIQLQREGDYWIASNGQVHLRALSRPIGRILRNLLKITTIEIAATSELDWQNYGLTPAQGIRVEVYEDNHLSEDFWIGHSIPDSEGPDSLAFIRIHEEQEVYAVKGLEASPFRRSFLHFRPKTILSLPADLLIDSFAYRFADTLFTFERKGSGWRLNGALLPDPGPVNRYLQNLRRLEGTTFADDFDNNQSGSYKYRSLMLYPEGTAPPILLDVYLDTLREQPYILRSTQNPTTWLASDSSGVYSRLFWEMGRFGLSAD